MAAIGLSDWLVRALQFLPASVHRSLDAWSYRQALKRRNRRNRPSQRH